MFKFLKRCILALALIVSVTPAFNASGAAGPPGLSVDTPVPNTKNVGDVFSVQVNIATNGQPITGWQFGFTYDPTVIELQGSSGAQAVGSNLPRTVFGTFLEDNLPPNGSVGGVSFKLIGSVGTTATVQPGGRVLTGQDANTGSNGSGKLASFTFKALANGTSPITLTSVKVTDVNAGAIGGVIVSPLSPAVVVGAAPAPETATPTVTSTATETQTPEPSSTPTPGPTATITPTSAPVCVSDAHPTLDGTSMTFSPATPSMLVGGSAVIIVNLNTATNQSFGMQFGLTYDPAVISVDSIDAGSFYGDAISTRKWDLNTPGNIPIGGVTLLGADTGMTGSGAVASIHITAKSLGTTSLTLICAADSVPNSTGSATISRPPATRGTSKVNVTVPPEPTTTETPTATPAPSATPKPIATVVVEGKNVHVGDVFSLDVTLSNLSPRLMMRVVSFGISSSPPGIVKVAKVRGQAVDIGSAFTDFATQSHGATSAGIGKPFVIDSASGNVLDPGAIELTSLRGANGGPTGGVVATIHMQALATGTADVKLLVIDNPPLGKTCPPCATLLDHIGISTLSATDTTPKTAGAILSGGHITVGSANPATATVTLTPTVTTTATAGTQSPTPTLTPTTGPSLTPNPTQTQKPQETTIPTSTPIALGNTTIGLSPARATPATGASFKIDVTISGGVPLRAFQFGLLFDPKVVRVDSVDPGPVFNTWADANGASVSVIPSFDVDNTKGTVAKGGINLLGGQGSPSGNGVLATISLKSVGDGTSPLTLTDLGLSIPGGIVGSGFPKNDTWCIASPAQLPVDCLLKATIPINNGQVFIGAAAQATAAALPTLTPIVGATSGPTPVGGAVPSLTSDPNAQVASGGPSFVDPNTGAVVNQSGAPSGAQGVPTGPAGAVPASGQSPAVQPGARPFPQVSGAPAGPAAAASASNATTQNQPATGAAPPPAGGPANANGSALIAGTPPAGQGSTASVAGATVRAGASPTPLMFDISRAIDTRGVLTQEVRLASPDGAIKLLIPAGTVALTRDKRPVRVIEVLPSDDLPVVPDDVFVASAGYEFGPSGATFSPPITVSLPYDPATIPDNMADDDVEPAFFDTTGSGWVALGGTADPIARTVTAHVAHFTTFAVLTKRGGVNWLLFAGIILVELGLGALGALVIRRSRAGGGSITLPFRGPWSRRPKVEEVALSPLRRTSHIIAPLAMAVLALGLTGSSARADGSSLGFEPPVVTAAPGETFSVDVVITVNQQIRGAQFGLKFDPSTVQVASVSEGTFLKDWAKANHGQSAAAVPFRVDNSRGEVSIGGIVLLGGDSNGGPSGTGVLATVKGSLAPTAAAGSPLSLTAVKLASTLPDAAGVPDVAVLAGQVSLGAPAPAAPPPTPVPQIAAPPTAAPVSDQGGVFASDANRQATAVVVAGATAVSLQGIVPVTPPPIQLQQAPTPAPAIPTTRPAAAAPPTPAPAANVTLIPRPAVAGAQALRPVGSAGLFIPWEVVGGIGGGTIAAGLLLFALRKPNRPPA